MPTQRSSAQLATLSTLGLTAFNELKQIGSATSATRTVDQTRLAHLFAGVGYATTAFAVWNNIARDVSRERHYSLIETTRLFAQLNVSMNDGVQTSHMSKFIYGLWRPITAIQRADEDFPKVAE